MNKIYKNQDHKKYVYFIDKTKFTTDEENLTVLEIMTDGGLDPGKKTLVLKEDLKELNDLNEIIQMKNGLHFTVFDKQPTTVS